MMEGSGLHCSNPHHCRYDDSWSNTFKLELLSTCAARRTATSRGVRRKYLVSGREKLRLSNERSHSLRLLQDVDGLNKQTNNTVYVCTLKWILLHRMYASSNPRRMSYHRTISST
jgi:hypothetical protein